MRVSRRTIVIEWLKGNGAIIRIPAGANLQTDFTGCLEDGIANVAQGRIAPDSVHFHEDSIVRVTGWNRYSYCHRLVLARLARPVKVRTTGQLTCWKAVRRYLEGNGHQRICVPGGVAKAFVYIDELLIPQNEKDPKCPYGWILKRKELGEILPLIR